MTSKLKCPFCGKELVPTTMGDNDTVLYASVWLPIKNCICNTTASKKIWQALIQAKQDLEIALTAIKEIAEECGCLMAALKSTGFESVVETFDKNIRKKLEQIEHKEI